jgi:hypothetical protein
MRVGEAGLGSDDALTGISQVFGRPSGDHERRPDLAAEAAPRNSVMRIPVRRT